ncbi:MAG: hypothetical protein GXP49_04195 [Deltaproteobacteria bacterium]|nr:hypothetical protein [Deltaproteobacteria bacterium]
MGPVAFTHGARMFGLEPDYVIEARPFFELVELPGSPKGLLGCVLQDGQFVPAVDAGIILNEVDDNAFNAFKVLLVVGKGSKVIALALKDIPMAIENENKEQTGQLQFLEIDELLKSCEALVQGGDVK